MSGANNWQDLIADKKKRQLAAIPKDWLIQTPPIERLDVTGVPAECGLLTSFELEITDTQDVSSILKKLASGEWSSVDVTRAYYKRAIIAQQLVNCLTEIFVERALARAAELDAHLKTTGKVVGPLHGLPISMKDQLNIKGLETTIGYASWVGKYADRDAALVEVLYEAGAVPLVKTNLPQTIMWPETFNNVFGRTSNPYNRSLTSGGSSGGEGALVGIKGSPLGVGSDIGGSIRGPAAFNGLYGLRPSRGRVPYWGTVNSLEGQDSAPFSYGPLSPSLSGIKAFMQAVIASNPWTKDPSTVRKAWDEEAYHLSEHGGGKDLVFGILWDDGVEVPHPPITRGLEMTKKALLEAGHKVIDWQPHKHKEINANLGLVWNAGSTDEFRNITAISGEPLITTMVPGGKGQDAYLPPSKGSTAYELWQLQNEKLQLRKEYLDHWEATAKVTGTGRPVDAIITPVAACNATPHGMNRSTSYTMVWNSLDYAASVFPVSKVDPSIDVKKPAHRFKSEADRYNYELYEPEVFRNAPIGLQLVGRTLEEEAVIGMTEIVDSALKAFKSNSTKL